MDSPLEKFQLVPTGKSVYHIVLAFLSTLSHGITIAFGVKTDISIKLKCEFAASGLTQNQSFLAGPHFFWKLWHQLHNKLVHISNVTVLEVRAQTLVSSLWALLQRNDRRILEIIQFHHLRQCMIVFILEKELAINAERPTLENMVRSFSQRDNSHRFRLIDSFRQCNSLLYAQGFICCVLAHKGTLSTKTIKRVKLNTGE